MMTNDDMPLANDPSGTQPAGLLPTTVTEQQNGEWGSAAMVAQPAESTAPDLMVYLHAFRRHWLMALGIGLLCAAILGPGVWFGAGAKYTADSFLRVSMQEPQVLGREIQWTDRDKFEIYKNTQQQLVLSRFVLLAALRKPEVAKLPSIQYEQQYGDPVGWLLKRLSVGFPGKAEIMGVSVTRDDPREAVILVAAVVDAYMTEVVNAERDLKRQRLSELDRICTEKETELRSKRTDLKQLAEQLGTSDTETLTLKQKLALEELTIYRQEMARVQFDVRRLRGELAGQQALLKNVDVAEIPSGDVDALVMNDPVARQLSTELGLKKMDEVYTKSVIPTGAKNRYADRFGNEIQMLEEQYNTRLAKLREDVRQRKRSLLEQKIEELKTSLDVWKAQEETVAADVEKQRTAAERFGGSSLDIEMMRSDVKKCDETLALVGNEREKLKVEVRSLSRVTLLQRAEVPETASNEKSRIGLTILAVLAGLCCPAALLTVWDLRAKRINNCADVSKRLRLPVIGSVPQIPARVIRRLGSPSKRYQTWQVRLTESVDGIAARVLRKAEMEQCRVLMVSSATGGEGKTTLATQLALSLARAGRRTVLVDFDLRRPAFDEVFGLPLEPGVCEVLRQQAELSSLVHQTATGNLAVVTAGRWDRLALASLSNGAAASMFKELRDEYDFVVIDTSPILPVADARFVSQYVDSVVLSVFRDISEAPKIQAACEILAAFGVRSIEAVVTGPNVNMYGQHTGYESTVSA
jgi:capsular exopolysaccharide synthesis family protein